MKNIVICCRFSALAAGAGVIFFATGVNAADPITFQLGLASQYIGKGIGKSNEEVSVSGLVELSHNGFYANVFAATAELAQGADAEVVVASGYRTAAAGYGLDLAIINRDLPGTKSGIDANFTEYQADVSHKFGLVSARLRLNYTEDGFAATQQAWWVELQCGANLDANTKATVALADRTAHGGAEYTAWNAGVKRKLPHDLAVDLRWYDTDNHRLGDAYAGRFVTALTYSF